MASGKKASVLLFLLVSLIFISSEEIVRVEGRTCTTPSAKYKGACLVRDSNCRSVCMSEGFSDGDCHGVRRRCLCRKPC